MVISEHKWLLQVDITYIYIYIYLFGRCFNPKQFDIEGQRKYNRRPQLVWKIG